MKTFLNGPGWFVQRKTVRDSKARTRFFFRTSRPVHTYNIYLFSFKEKQLVLFVAPESFSFELHKNYIEFSQGD